MSTEYNIDSGISPTMGVILMVAIAVIISVVIGSFALGFGGNTDESVQAGVDIQQQGDGKYQVQWQTAGNAEELQVLVNGTELDNTTLSNPGESVTVGVSEGDTISVTGTTSDTTTQVSSTTASSGSTSTPTVTSTPETTLSNSTSSDTSGSGETVTVDYSVTNESDSEKDMTVTLDVSDGVGEVDSTTESTVSSGETRTGSLTWDVPSDQEAGEYTLTTSGGGETDSTTVEIQETPSFDIDVSSTSAHVGDTVSFSAKNVDATNPSYKWDFDDGNSKNGKSVDHVFQSSGTYNVSATVTGDNGLSKTKDISISITQQNLIAAYDFEQSSGDLIDQTGNGHNGTVSGPTRDVSGVSGSAYQFDGSNNDNVSIPNDSQLNPSQITVSTWVYWTGSGKEYIIEKADDPDKGYGLTINSASQIQFGIGNGSGYDVAASSNTFPKNRWVSVVGTYDGSTVKTYVDGEEVASTSSGTISDDSGPFMFGAHANSPNSSNFNGKIDETEVYNTALSESEVKEISNSNGGTVVEDFDTDLSEYTVVDSHGTATVDTAPSNGPSNKALKISSDNGTPQIQSVGSNNIKYPEAGDTITYYHYSGSSASSQVPMYFFGVQSEEDFPSNAYYIRHDSRDNKFALNIANNGSYSTLAETSTTFPSYEWIKTEIVWETDGTISVTTWDSQGNEIASVSANDTTHTSGGMGFSLGLNSGSQHSVWFDYIKKE